MAGEPLCTGKDHGNKGNNLPADIMIGGALFIDPAVFAFIIFFLLLLGRLSGRQLILRQEEVFVKCLLKVNAGFGIIIEQ